MKLIPKKVPYSSVVGGGLMLCKPSGQAMFIVNFMGTTEGITREETEALSEQLEAMINVNGLSVPSRQPGPPR